MTGTSAGRRRPGGHGLPTRVVSTIRRASQRGAGGRPLAHYFATGVAAVAAIAVVAATMLAAVRAGRRGRARRRRAGRLATSRFSGGTAGACIGHVSPESAEGGPVGLLKQGDRLRIDFPNRKIDFLVSEQELAERKKTWHPVKRN